MYLSPSIFSGTQTLLTFGAVNDGDLLSSLLTDLFVSDLLLFNVVHELNPITAITNIITIFKTYSLSVLSTEAQISFACESLGH
jgi:hypothetical protein